MQKNLNAKKFALENPYRYREIVKKLKWFCSVTTSMAILYQIKISLSS